MKPDPFVANAIDSAQWRLRHSGEPPTMCISEYAQQRLQEWAEWSWQRVDGGGYRVPQVAYREWEPRATGTLANLPMAARALETEMSVSWLLRQQWRLGQVVVVVYRDCPHWGSEAVASFINVSRQTLWRRLDKAHSVLLEIWIDHAVGIRPQLEGLRGARQAA